MNHTIYTVHWGYHIFCMCILLYCTCTVRVRYSTVQYSTVQYNKVVYIDRNSTAFYVIKNNMYILHTIYHLYDLTFNKMNKMWTTVADKSSCSPPQCLQYGSLKMEFRNHTMMNLVLKPYYDVLSSETIPWCT